MYNKCNIPNVYTILDIITFTNLKCIIMNINICLSNNYVHTSLQFKYVPLMHNFSIIFMRK